MRFDRRLIGLVITVEIALAVLVLSGRLTLTSAVKLPASERGASALAVAIDHATPISSLPAVSTLKPGGTLTIMWRTADLKRAEEAGSVCVYAEGPGEICAGYTAGEVPAESLMNELRVRGYTPRTA